MGARSDGVVKLQAFRQLAAAIVDWVPELKGAVEFWPTPPNKVEKYPSLAIVPSKAKYIPDQAEEIDFDPGPNEAVMNVGTHEVTVQLRAIHATPPQRADIEEQILDLFLSDGDRPGIVITPVLSVPRFGKFICSWELEDSDWSEEMAFDHKFWTYITITGQIPALVVRRGAYRIRELQLGLTVDNKERGNWIVNGDGTITPI